MTKAIALQEAQNYLRHLTIKDLQQTKLGQEALQELEQLRYNGIRNQVFSMVRLRSPTKTWFLDT